MSVSFSHCPTCGQEYDSACRCGCLVTYGAARGDLPVSLVAEPSAEKLREVAALERIAALLESIDDTLRSMADLDPRSW